MEHNLFGILGKVFNGNQKHTSRENKDKFKV